MKLLFFDTETTALKPGNICQLSYITVDTGFSPQRVESKNLFFKVDFVEPSAEDIHGFSVEKLEVLSNGNRFLDKYVDVYQEFLSADMVIGHNVQFDIKFLTKELEACGISYKPNSVFCTMQYYKSVCKLIGRNGDLKNPKLSEVTNFLCFSNKDIERAARKLFGDSGAFHDARFDTTATYLIVVEGIKKGHIPRGHLSKIVNP